MVNEKLRFKTIFKAIASNKYWIPQLIELIVFSFVCFKDNVIMCTHLLFRFKVISIVTTDLLGTINSLFSFTVIWNLQINISLFISILFFKFLFPPQNYLPYRHYHYNKLLNKQMKEFSFICLEIFLVKNSFFSKRSYFIVKVT